MLLTGLYAVSSQLGCGTHRRLLSAVRCTAGAGGRKRDPRPAAAREEDETTEEEHAAGEGQKSEVGFMFDLYRKLKAALGCTDGSKRELFKF